MAKNPSLLFPPIPASGPYEHRRDNPDSNPYEAIRDDPCSSDVKTFLEELWTQYHLYADRNFLKEIRNKENFFKRLWELQLGCILLQEGYELKQAGNGGPDFLITLDHKKVWIEAIAPGVGKTEDAVPPLVLDSKIVQSLSDKEEKIVLRFTQTIDKKWKKYTGYIDAHGKKHKGYLEKGIIHDDDCYIIAISGSDLGGWHTPIGDNSIPYIIRAVLPFGREMMIFDRETRDIDSGYKCREQISKNSGCKVSTEMFLKEEYAGISAIIYSERSLMSFPISLGKDHLLYLHNQLATHKLPQGAFKFCKEYWFEGKSLKSKDWSKE